MSYPAMAEGLGIYTHTEHTAWEMKLVETINEQNKKMKMMSKLVINHQIPFFNGNVSMEIFIYSLENINSLH